MRHPRSSPPADLQGRGGVGNLVAEPEGHAREFKEGSGAADRVSRAFAREVGPRLQEAHAQQGMAVPVWRRGSSRSAERLREASGHLRGRSGAPWNASLPIWRYRHSGRLLPPASPRFARAATACGAGSERRQSAVPQVRAMPCRRACGPARWGKRLSYGNGFAIFSRYVTEPPGSPVRKLSPDARYPAFRVDSGDCLALEGDFGTPVVRYGNISKIFFDSITVSEETGRCGRASSRDRRLARRRGARDARRSVADPGNRRSTLLPRALRRAGAPCLLPSRGNATIERQARGACPAKKPNPIINRRFPRR